jgi:DNA-binding response OmpR family regulator
LWDDLAKATSALSYAPRILIVDDESEVRAFYEQALSEDGYCVTAVGTARHGLRALSDGEFQVIVLDLSLPDGDGLEIVRQIRGEHPDLRILAISGFMVGDMSSIALAAGATATLMKPTIPREFLNTVYRLLDPSEAWTGRPKRQTAG